MSLASSSATKRKRPRHFTNTRLGMTLSQQCALADMRWSDWLTLHALHALIATRH